MEIIKHYTIPLQESVMTLLMKATGQKTAKGALETAISQCIEKEEKNSLTSTPCGKEE